MTRLKLSSPSRERSSALPSIHVHKVAVPCSRCRAASRTAGAMSSPVIEPPHEVGAQAFQDEAVAASEVEEVLGAGEGEVAEHVLEHRRRVGPEHVVDPLLDDEHAAVVEEAVPGGLGGELEVLSGDDLLRQGVQGRGAEVGRHRASPCRGWADQERVRTAGHLVPTYLCGSRPLSGVSTSWVSSCTTARRPGAWSRRSSRHSPHGGTTRAVASSVALG